MNLAYKKILGKFTKVLGFGKTPPPHVGKNSQIISFFLERTLLKMQLWMGHNCRICSLHGHVFFWGRLTQTDSCKVDSEARSEFWTFYSFYFFGNVFKVVGFQCFIQSVSFAPNTLFYLFLLSFPNLTLQFNTCLSSFLFGSVS